MSRETLLDNAIAKAKEAEDWQLVEWLRMARGGESAARWYSKKLREASRAERKLLDENDKLRELVNVMAYCMQYERDCDECRMNGADGNIAEPCGCDGLLDRLRELGVEVDG